MCFQYSRICCRRALHPFTVVIVPGATGVTLSGGQQMRLALARVFYQQPQLIIADDPLAAVDAEVGQKLFRSLQEYTDSTAGRSVILAMNQCHLMSSCTRILHVEAGKLVADGTFERVVTANDKFSQMAESKTIMAESLDVDREDDGDDETTDSKSREVAVEARAVGSVDLSRTLNRYLRSFGRFHCVLCLVVAIVAWGVMAFNDRWLATWIEHAEDADPNTTMYITVYIIGTFIFLLGLIASSTLVAIGSANAARSVHGDCVKYLMRAPVSYFETTPSGRLVSRFSADVANVDQQLGQFGDNWLQFTATLLAIYVVVIWILPVMAVGTVIVSVGTYFQIMATDRSNREVKRLANNMMAPILTDISEAVDGRILLRNSYSSTKYVLHAGRGSAGAALSADIAVLLDETPPAAISAEVATA